MRPARCGGMTLPTSALCVPKSVSNVLVAGSTRVTLPPSDSDTHSSRPGYSFGHAAWNSFCLENASFASSSSSFERGFLRLEVVRDQAGAFIRAGRTAIGIRRCRHDHQAAIRHRLKLASQQQGLRAGLPGVRHAFGSGLVVAGQRAPGDVDAGRQDQAVVRQDGAVAQGDAARRGIDRRGFGLYHANALGRDCGVGEALRGDVAKSGDHLVAERAGGELRVGFDQRDVEARIGATQEPRGGGAAETAAHHDDTRRRLGARDEGREQEG